MATTWVRRGNKMYELDDNGNHTGRRYDLSMETGANYINSDSIFAWSRGKQSTVKRGFEFLIKNGRLPTSAELNSTGKAYKNNIADIKNMAKINGITLEEADGTFYISGGIGAPDTYQAEPTGDAQLDAMNAYYQDLYSLEDGTSGASIYGNLTNANMTEAQQAYNIADLTQQDQAMQQAATIKQIADQVKAERMAKLRAGMSESQIANQDMQMMMANVNALNEQANVASQARYDATTGMSLAQSNAYRDYLEAANAQGTVASTMYASDVANPISIADMLKQRQAKDSTYTSKYFNTATGQTK